ncbi:MAG: ArnT family glycosyltransferase [Bacteroidia bacterium]
MPESKSFNIFFWAALIAIAVIYCIGMQINLMDLDSTQYALISKEMFISGNYLQVLERGHDYLDKPPLIFWSACLSFKLFGIHDWAYRLPSVLCLILGLYSVYRYTKLFYEERAAKIAVLIMASCCASYLMTNDVRTDTLLTGWVIFSIWQIAEFNTGLKFRNILLASIGIGMAMLAKGPIGLIVPVTAFSIEFMYKRQWKNFFRWQYLVALVVIALILLPMSYGLYEQFDLHPEKYAYSMKSPSGLKFFYWTQSFGRITGESTWNNDPDPFFLVHSFFWSFLPWTALFLPAIFIEVKNKIISFNKPDKNEAITIGGFFMIFLFLSLSKYQLPHYTFVIHPLAAVIAANYINRNTQAESRPRLFSAFWGLNVFVMFVMYGLALLIINFIFPSSMVLNAAVVFSLVAFLFILFNKKFEFKNKVVIETVIASVTLGLIVNLYFYPNLLNYQAGSHVAQDLNKIASKDSKLLIYNSWAENSMAFYTAIPFIEPVRENSLPGYLVKGKTYIYADSADSKALQRMNPDISVVKNYDNFPVTHLSTVFLNPSTRNSTLQRMVLLKY